MGAGDTVVQRIPQGLLQGLRAPGPWRPCACPQLVLGPEALFNFAAHWPWVSWTRGPWRTSGNQVCLTFLLLLWVQVLWGLRLGRMPLIPWGHLGSTLGWGAREGQVS